MLLSHIGREASWPMGKADVSLSLIGRRELEKSGRALKWYGKKVLFGLVKMDCFHNYLENCWCPCSWWKHRWSFGWWREWRTVFSPLCKCMPFPIYRILKAFIWDQTEQQHLLWNIIFSLSFIALQVLICFWSLLQFKGHIYLNLSFISNLRVLSTPPGPFQALNPKKWWQPKKSGQHGRFVPWSSIPNVLSLSSPRSVIFPPPKSLPQQTRPIRGEDTRN